MLFKVLFSVIAVSSISIKEVQTKAVRELDIENLLRSIQQPLQKEQSQQQREQQQPDEVDRGDSTSSHDDDDDDDEFRTGTLRGQEVKRLIKLARDDREDKNRQIEIYIADDRDEGVVQQLLQQLNLLQNRNKKRQNKGDKNRQYLPYRDEDNDDGDNGLDEEILQQLNLLQKVQKRDKKQQNKDDRYRQLYRDDSDDPEALDQQLSHQFNLLQNVQDKRQQFRPNNRVKKQRQQPNNLLSSVDDRSNNLLQSLNKDDRDDDLDLGKYSNIYVVLNPDSVKRSENKDKLNDFLSNLLSSSNPSQRDRRERRKDVRYKGFLVKDKNVLMRRRNRESKEIFAKGNSNEGEYRPKRSRGERGGGGAGSGRTAIPYIRHHGDIYEKDN